MIAAEVQANNIRVTELADEQGFKVAQNMAAGVVGLVIWPVWSGMDFKGSASKEVAALQGASAISYNIGDRTVRPTKRAAAAKEGWIKGTVKCSNLGR